MIDLTVAVEELKTIIDSNIHDYVLPEKDGGTIKLGHTIIRKSRTAGYLVFDARKQQQIANIYSKHAALVYAKNYINNRDNRAVLDLDRCLEKNEMDVIFFQHTIETTRNEIRRAIATDRLKNCELVIDNTKQKLESLLLDK